MNLEVISRKPKGKTRATPLLFVHGAYGGAWIWDQHFLPYFAENGYEAHALSLRGHGESAGWEGVGVARLWQYVADLRQVAATLDTPPALIGHSMGGMVVQKYMHEHETPAAVLMASVPPHGLAGSFLGMALGNPGLFVDMAKMQIFGPAISDGDSVRRALFSDETSQETIDKMLHRLQGESTMAIVDLLGLDLPPSTPTLDLPVLVLGAENDSFVFRGALDATAKTYRTRAEIFPRMAHAMMLEHSWESVAKRIVDWLDETLPDGDARPAARSRRKRVAPEV
jgi:pimeloyl-ACP methyl ester carboxylesterase